MEVIDKDVNTTIKSTWFVTSNNAGSEEKAVEIEQELYCQIEDMNEQKEHDEGGEIVTLEIYMEQDVMENNED